MHGMTYREGEGGRKKRKRGETMNTPEHTVFVARIWGFQNQTFRPKGCE